ncbi:MAG TPA: type II secretion system protein [Patescibacteria group bacterium]
MTALKKGFTLIELLMVMAIIAVIATFFITYSTGGTKKARDAKRESDIKQYQNSLEIYAAKNNTLYPSRTSGVGVQASVTTCQDLTLTSCPEDPINGSNSNYMYRYQSDGTGNGTVTGTRYVLWAQFEGQTGYWVVCSNGKTGIMASVTVSTGTCPLP